MRKFNGCDRLLALAFSLYAASITVMPIILLKLLAEFGFSLTDAGLLEFIRAVTLFFCLFAVIYLTKYFSKGVLLFFGALLLFLSFIVFIFTPRFAVLLQAMLLCGFGGGLLEALINPAVEELHPQDNGSILTMMNGFFSLGVVLTMIGGGFMLNIGLDWRWLYIVLLLPTALVAGGFFYLTINKVFHKGGAQTKHKNSLLFKNLQFWILGCYIFLGGGIEAAFNYWSASLTQIEFSASPLAGGIATAIFSLGMVLGRLKGYLVIDRLGLAGFLFFSCLLGFAVSFFIAQLNSYIPLIILLFLTGLATAAHWPSIQALAVRQLRGDTTFIYIILSCYGILGYSLTPLVLGYLGDRIDLKLSFLLIPFLFLIMMLALLFNRKINKKKINVASS